MTRYASKDFKDLKVGINSFSDGKTSLEVAGRLGVNTSAAEQELHVEGSAYFSNSIGIGTTAPGDVVDVANRQKISVGIVTANEYYGSGLGLTGITSAGSASNIFGGGAGRLLYQEATGVTSFFENGSTGRGLYSRGPGQPPQWLPVAPAGAIEGITIFDEGALVATAGSFGALNIVGDNLSVIGFVTFGEVGVATITLDSNVVFDGLTVNGVSTASTIMGADYFGTGDNITGLVTSFSISGAGLTFQATERLGSFGKGVVTLTAIATTENVKSDTLFVTGISTLNNANITGTFQNGTFNNTNLTGITTIAGLNVSGITTTDTLNVSGLTTSKDLIVTGITTIKDGNVTGTIQNGTFNNTNLTGVTTVADLNVGILSASTLIAVAATFTGNLTVGGTLTYSDVSNVDSVGLITAQQGIHIGNPDTTGIAATLTAEGGADFTGIVTAANFVGSGALLTGIVTSLVAGDNISVSAATGEVTITGLANTANIFSDTMVVSGVSTLGGGVNIGGTDPNVAIGVTINPNGDAVFAGVITATNLVGEGSNITGIVTSLVAGNNISISGSTGVVTITGLAKTDNINADQLTVIGVSTLGGGVNIGGTAPNVAIGVTLENTGDAQFAGIITSKNLIATESVGIGTTSLNSSYALEVKGNANVDGELTTNGNTVPSLAMVIALGGL